MHLHLALRLALSAVGSTVESIVGCCAGSEVTVVQMRRYIFKNHLCFEILNSRNKIPFEVGVADSFAVGSTVGVAVGSVGSVFGCCAVQRLR